MASRNSILALFFMESENSRIPTKGVKTDLFQHQNSHPEKSDFITSFMLSRKKVQFSHLALFLWRVKIRFFSASD
jgi:hypothetical protein